MKLDSGADDAYMRDRDTQISPQGEYILAMSGHLQFVGSPFLGQRSHISTRSVELNASE